MQILEPYSSYQDVPAPWLKSAPSYWQVLRGKRVFAFRKELNKDRANSNVLSLTLRGVVNNNLDNPEGLVPKDYASYQIFKKNDLVFKLIDLENVRTSRIGLVHEDGIMSPAYLRLSIRKAGNIKFFFYQYYDLYLRIVYNKLGAGVRSTLNQEDLLNLPILVPDMTEQDAIARYLDYYDRLVRQYIRGKQSQIKLLNQQKQIIIQNAVTNGLNSAVRLKSSETDWLGNIPEHWQIAPSKFYFREVDERSKTGKEELLSVSHITGVTPRSQKNVNMFMAESNIGHKICRPGDLVVNTMWAWMAALGIANQTGIVSPSYAVYRLIDSRKFVPDYLDYLLRTQPYKSEYRIRSTGIRPSRLRLYPEKFLTIQLFQPSYSEQEQIVSYIKSAIAPIENAIAGINYEINTIQEYRTRLISDIVTGKVDVREAAKNLPEIEILDIPESTPIEDLELSDELEDAEEIEDANE